MMVLQAFVPGLSKAINDVFIEVLLKICIVTNSLVSLNARLSSDRWIPRYACVAAVRAYLGA